MLNSSVDDEIIAKSKNGQHLKPIRKVMNASLYQTVNPTHTISIGQLMNSDRVAQLLNSENFEKNFIDIHERAKAAFNSAFATAHDHLTFKNTIRKPKGGTM